MSKWALGNKILAAGSSRDSIEEKPPLEKKKESGEPERV